MENDIKFFFFSLGKSLLRLPIQLIKDTDFTDKTDIPLSGLVKLLYPQCSVP